ncbi:hypothetical protein ABZ801_16600 [Actinomadura sp. NPDC047616]
MTVQLRWRVVVLAVGEDRVYEPAAWHGASAVLCRGRPAVAFPA